MKKVIVLILVVGAIVLGLYFWPRGGREQLPPPTGSDKAAPSARNSTQVETSIQAKELTVSGTEFSFSPQEIRVKAGEKVKLTFKNVGVAPHNWVIEGLGIKTKIIGSGQTDLLEFTAPTVSGTFNYIVFCSVPGHRESGMVGKLIVEP